MCAVRWERLKVSGLSTWLFAVWLTWCYVLLLLFVRTPGAKDGRGPHGALVTKVLSKALSPVLARDHACLLTVMSCWQFTKPSKTLRAELVRQSASLLLSCWCSCSLSSECCDDAGEPSRPAGALRAPAGLRCWEHQGSRETCSVSSPSVWGVSKMLCLTISEGNLMEKLICRRSVCGTTLTRIAIPRGEGVDVLPMSQEVCLWHMALISLCVNFVVTS